MAQQHQLLQAGKVADYLLEHAVQWLAGFDGINSGTEARICGKLSDSSIPGLSTANDTTLGYSSSQSEPFVPPRIELLPKHTLTNTTQLGPPPDPSTLASPLAAHSAASQRDSSGDNEYRKRNAIAVYYDGDAQRVLEHMVEQVAAAQNALQRRKRIAEPAGPRTPQEVSESDAVIDCLSTVSEACYTAAFKLLQDGDASREAQAVGVALQNMRSVLATGIMRQEETRRAEQMERARLEDAMVSPAPVPVVETISKISPAQPIEVDDDYDDDDLALPTIRLANRRGLR